MPKKPNGVQWTPFILSRYRSLCPRGYAARAVPCGSLACHKRPSRLRCEVSRLCVPSRLRRSGGASWGRSSPAGCLVCPPAGCVRASVGVPPASAVAPGVCRRLRCRPLVRSSLVSGRRRLAPAPPAPPHPCGECRTHSGVPPAAFGPPWLVGLLGARFPRLRRPRFAGLAFVPSAGWFPVRLGHRALAPRRSAFNGSERM